MKKLIVILALFVGVFTAKAQDFSGRIGTANKVLTTGADTIDITISKARSAISFHYQVTKNSGTVGGTIVTQARATNLSTEVWHTLDSYTITDATQEKWLTFTYNQALTYRIITTTSGGNSTHNKYLLYRQ